MAKMGLRRRMVPNTEEAYQVITEEINDKGSVLGCRGMQRRLLSHGLVVSRERVAYIQNVVDPIRVQERRQKHLRRRVYHNKGPNYLLHVDGYDKLKRFGFAIHGCVCGFSRRVLWLKVGRSNNDPKVIASYFLDYIREIKGVPRCIRSDDGTENCIIADIQRAFRWHHDDDMAGEKSFLTGSSPANQRIERWWLSNRQGGGQFWIEFFNNLEQLGKFSTSNPIQIECLRFCFTKLVQDDLNKCAQEWNQHRMRHTKSAELPGGKPDLMFYVPQLYDTLDYKIEIDEADVDAAEDFCVRQSASGCLEEFEVECKNILLENSWSHPSNHKEALALYEWLISYYGA
ncbi:uncharacterized protein LOC125661760 [Ostrea edulis]|uniref:uncharacterized protein LOC125661760 n=1 Tax=Ostrea edulis TaxID=37623 RepID=UPI0024AFAE05|nr:uncharacterized protein LOC125661760 [Ostrea edulis]